MNNARLIREENPLPGLAGNDGFRRDRETTFVAKLRAFPMSDFLET